MIELTCARNRCFGADAEDFAQDVMVKLLSGGVFDKFRGEASIDTFLGVTIANQYRDFRIKAWGKWRPSARATELGEVAVKLERLLSRDGLLLEEAVETLVGDPRVSASAEELRELAEKLPPRVGRRLVGESELQNRPSPQRADVRV